MAGQAGAPLQRVLHMGEGIARRDAYLEQCAADRAGLEGVDAEAAVAAEQRSGNVVRVAASSIEVEDDLPNYAPIVRREAKKARRKRQRDEAFAKQAVAVEDDVSGGDAVEEAERAVVLAPQPRAAQEEQRHTHDRYENELCDAFADEEDQGEEGVQETPLPQLQNEHGSDLSVALRFLRRRLKAYLVEQAANERTVAMVVGRTGLGTGAHYPSMHWTIQFGKWLASHRVTKSHASAWDEAAWKDAHMQRKTKGSNSVHVLLQHIKNHLWRELWPAMPDGVEARQYWHVVTKQVEAMFDGNGGGMKAAATLVEKRRVSSALQSGRTPAEAAAAGLEARKETMGMLRAATSKPCAKEHLYQVGEYQLQDTYLSDPFAVNLSYVMNAYSCFARVTGCRPGMAVNHAHDMDDAAGHWYEVPPLEMGSLAISPEALRQALANMTDKEMETLLRMEITFERKKGEYFACYDFGTAITPDSDEMVRIGTLAMIRLLIATASLRACYAKLNAAEAAALRSKVADPAGFAGLELESTGYTTWAALVAACRKDDWVLDEPAWDRPLFPGIDEKTGAFLFTETFDVQRLCNTLIGTGRGIGMNRHGVGAWSLRRDACEVVAKTGKGEVAARVLGHRHVNSRTMDRVYRADLRCRDLGAYWTGREEQVAGAPLTCLSARRVAEVGGVRSMADVPAGVEREAITSSASLRDAKAARDAARDAVQAPLGDLVRVGESGWKKLALQRNAGELVQDYEANRHKLNKLQEKAQDGAVRDYQLRCYQEGQRALRHDKAQMVANLATHAWAPRSEDAAIAFGLDRKDRTRELQMLRKLPAALQGSILSVGALHVLPSSGTPEQVYARVVQRCEGLCALRCEHEVCVDAPDMAWPETTAGFEARECECCGSNDGVRLCWQSEAAEDSSKIPLAAGARAVLGPSFDESYGLWYNLCGRATIGNAAFDTGRVVTKVMYGASADAGRSAAARMVSEELVQQIASEQHEIEAIVAERCTGKGRKRREYRVRWRGYDPSWEAWRDSGAIGTLVLLQRCGVQVVRRKVGHVPRAPPVSLTV
jgi:hypothetical protein